MSATLLKFTASVSSKIKDTYVINGTITIGTYILHYDVFVSEKKVWNTTQ